jgi:hypothetical protein
MCDRQHSPLNLSCLSVVLSAAICLAAFLFAQRTDAQVIVGGVTTAADLTQTVSGDCANYDSVLSSTGVSTNGQTHPGRCRSTALIPLFDGAPLGSNMLQFRNSHPDIFTSQRTQVKREFCVTNSKLQVTLSASLQATRLEWTGAPVVGAKCTNELVRVNAVSSPPSPAISPYNELLVSRLLHQAEQELMASPQLRECNRSSKAAELAVERQVWNLLQRIASDEIAHFGTSVAPMMDISSSCPAKCNLCFAGWVGSIQCTATANDPSYQWDETQNWDVGGVPTTGTAGSVIYPANFTAGGNGSKQNAPSWRINATTVGSLTDAGVNANKRFSTSNATVAGGIIWSTNVQPGALSEMQVKFNADQIGGNTATNDPTATIPSCINTQQRPANVACSVSCTWNLLTQ